MLTTPGPLHPFQFNFKQDLLGKHGLQTQACHPYAIPFGPLRQCQPNVAEAELPRGLLSCQPNGEEESPKVMAARMDKQGQLTEPKRET